MTHTYVVRFVICLLIILTNQPTSAQEQREDIVVVKIPNSNPPETANRVGRVLEWKGGALTQETRSGNREIENQSIVQVKTNWPASYLEGVQLATEGKSSAAIEQWQQALQEDSRRWVQAIIYRHLIEEAMLLDQPDLAVRSYLAIVTDDPYSRFLPHAPLPWAGAQATLPSAKEWLESPQAGVQLVGAGWSLSGSAREQATDKIGELIDDLDPRVSALATGYSWGLKPNPDPRQTQIWQTVVNQMLRSARPGPLFALATQQANTDQPDQAVINWMKVVTIYPEHRSLVAASLYRAGNLLQQQGQTDAAKTLLLELKNRFPESIWARQASRKVME